MYAIKLTPTIVLSIQLALFPVFSEALGMGQLSGIIAAILWIGAKVGTTEDYYRAGHTLQPVAQFVGWESFYCSILVAIAACCFRRYLDSSVSGSRRLAWILGCVIGVSMLISPTVGIIFIGFVALLLWRDKLAIFKGSNLSNLLLIALLPTVIVAPWIIRNFSVFHRFIPVRDNFGLEPSVSNNDYAMFGVYENARGLSGTKTHPGANIDEARKVLAYGEPEYNDLKLQEALSWIETHPARFFSLSALRVAAFGCNQRPKVHTHYSGLAVDWSGPPQM